MHSILCGNYGSLVSHNFCKKFRESNELTKHSVEKYPKKLSRRKNFRQTTQQKTAKSYSTNG